jgi:Carboxypeptidase regulatory-like domain
MSCSDRTRRDRPNANGLALWAALVLVALLTSCGSGQPERGISGRSAIEVRAEEHFALDMTHETLEPAAQPTEEGTNTGAGDIATLIDNVIFGHAYNAAGEALEGVNVYIRVVPESSQEPYRTTTDADGKYSLRVPEGGYQILAEYNPNDDPGGGVYLEPTNGDGSVTVPPDVEVDFQMSS